MSVTCTLLAIPREDLDEVLEWSTHDLAKLVERDTFLRLDLDNAWDLVHFAMTGPDAFEDEEQSLGFIEFGGELAEEIDLGYGPARLVHPALAAEALRQMNLLQEAELLGNFNGRDSVEEPDDLYPSGLEVFEEDDALDAFECTKDFMTKAVAMEAGVLVVLGGLPLPVSEGEGGDEEGEEEEEGEEMAGDGGDAESEEEAGPSFDILHVLTERDSWEAHFVRSERSGREGLLVTLEGAESDQELRNILLERVEPFLTLGGEGLARALEVGLGFHPPYVLFDIPAGHTLRRACEKAGGRLDAPTALAVVELLMRPLQAVHSAGLVHGFFNSDAVWLGEDGSLWLLFAGIGAIGDSLRLQTRGEAWRAPARRAYRLHACNAPEDLAGSQRSKVSDVFRVGLLLHELISGTWPFARPDELSELAAIRSEPPLPLEAPAEVVELVLGLLAKSPADRPGDAAAVAREISAVRALTAKAEPPEDLLRRLAPRTSA